MRAGIILSLGLWIIIAALCTGCGALAGQSFHQGELKPGQQWIQTTVVELRESGHSLDNGAYEPYAVRPGRGS